MTVGRHLRGAGRARFAAEDAPRVVDGLEWLLGAYAWAVLLVAPAPWAATPRPVRLGWAPSATAAVRRPAPGRIAVGLGGALGLALAGALALVPWLAGAACLIVAGRMPQALARPAAAVVEGHARLLRRLCALGPPSPSTALRGRSRRAPHADPAARSHAAGRASAPGASR